MVTLLFLLANRRDKEKLHDNVLPDAALQEVR